MRIVVSVILRWCQYWVTNRIRTGVVVGAFYLLIVVVFLGGVFAGRWTAGYPFSQTFGYWDVSRTLGGAAEAKGSRASVAQAFLNADVAEEEMDYYLWVPPTTPVPMLDYTNAAEPGFPIVGPGFRSEFAPSNPKPAGVKRVFLVGGSTAFSVGAPSEAWTIGERLEYYLNVELKEPVEVFTLASPSWTSNHERVAALNIVALLQPDLVVSLSGVNDLAFAQLGREPNLQRVHYEQTYFDIVASAYRLAGRGEIHDPLLVTKTSIPAEVAIHRVVENVALIRFGLDRAGSKYLYVLQPTLYQGTNLTRRETEILAEQPQAKTKYFEDGYPKIALAVKSELGDEGVLDLSDVFASRGSEDEEMFIDAYHFGDRGNDQLAKAMTPQVIQLLKAQE